MDRKFDRRPEFNSDRPRFLPISLPEEFVIGENSDYESTMGDYQSELSDEVFQHEQMEVDKKDDAVKLVENMLQNMVKTYKHKYF